MLLISLGVWEPIVTRPAVQESDKVLRGQLYQETELNRPLDRRQRLPSPVEAAVYLVFPGKEESEGSPDTKEAKGK